MPRRARRSLLLVLQAAFVSAVLWYAAVSIARQWSGVRRDIRALQPRWDLICLSAVLVLAAYAVLIHTWRVMLAAWGGRLSSFDATRVWFVSNLGKYVPGKVWQIAAMAVMAQARGISPITATGASLVVNLANVLSGFLMVLLTGGEVLQLSSRGGLHSAVLIAGALIAALLALPVLLPALARLAFRVTGRDIPFPRIPALVVWAAVGGTALAWLVYGGAFQLLTAGVLGAAPGTPIAYTAVFTSSYLIGYLALIAPGGIGVREAMLVAGLTRLGLTSEPQAWVLAVVSRLWLTVLEIVPGVLLLARWRSSTARNHDVAP